MSSEAGGPRPAPAASTIGRRRGIDVMTWPALAGQGVDAVVTTRAGGVSQGPYASLNLGLHVGDHPARVVENRRRAAAAVGVGLEDLVFCRQTHGRAVATVTAADRGRGSRGDADAVEATDALATATPGVALVMMAADCTPIVLYEPVAGVAACVHSGWRGTVARVVDAAVEAMVALGASPPRIVAGVGPCVAAARYQVGAEVVAAAGAAFGDVEGIVAGDGTGRWTFDLEAANVRILAEAGLDPENVHRSVKATGTPQFFSDRARRPCGRHAAIVVLRPGAVP
ncbi:MAG: peptidoglycan editing factor PgeF [Acidimicrobiales bacterium]